MKYWQTLLLEQKKKGKKGFTIPYIIGSQKYLPNTFSLQDVKALIVDIATSTQFPVFLKYCMDTNDLILEIKSDETIGISPEYGSKPQTNFFISTFNNDFGDTIEAIATSLSEKYQSFVNLKQFSKTVTTRADFSQKESEEIQTWFSVYK